MKEDVLLKNEEAVNAIRKIVAISLENGLSKTNCRTALDTIWNEMCSNAPATLTEDEKEYLAKTEKFVEYYQIDLLNARIQPCGDSKKYLMSVKCILTTLYILRCKGITTNATQIEKYVKLYFGSDVQLYSYGVGMREILNYFFSNLKFDSENEKKLPEFERGYSPNKKTIWQIPEYEEFLGKYKANARSWTETSLMSVWMIKNFF